MQEEPRNNRPDFKPSPWFKVYSAWQPQIKALSDSQVGQLFKGAIAYANTGIEPQFDDSVLNYAFIPFKESVTACNTAVERKRQGGIKSGDTRRKQAEERQNKQ
jgi:hypothetical protein